MSDDLNALLKRSFAEAHEPADDGFSVRIAHTVERREKSATARQVAWGVSMAVAGTAVVAGLFQIAGVFGPELMASVGLEVARAHGAISSAPDVGTAVQGMMQSFGAGLTQLLLLVAAGAGGMVAFRHVRE